MLKTDITFSFIRRIWKIDEFQFGIYFSEYTFTFQFIFRMENKRISI